MFQVFPLCVQVLSRVQFQRSTSNIMMFRHVDHVAVMFQVFPLCGQVPTGVKCLCSNTNIKRVTATLNFLYSTSHIDYVTVHFECCNLSETLCSHFWQFQHCAQTATIHHTTFIILTMSQSCFKFFHSVSGAKSGTISTATLKFLYSTSQYYDVSLTMLQSCFKFFHSVVRSLNGVKCLCSNTNIKRVTATLNFLYSTSHIDYVTVHFECCNLSETLCSHFWQFQHCAQTATIHHTTFVILTMSQSCFKFFHSVFRCSVGYNFNALRAILWCFVMLTMLQSCFKFFHSVVRSPMG